MRGEPILWFWFVAGAAMLVQPHLFERDFLDRKIVRLFAAPMVLVTGTVLADHYLLAGSLSDYLTSLGRTA